MEETWDGLADEVGEIISASAGSGRYKDYNIINNDDNESNDISYLPSGGDSSLSILRVSQLEASVLDRELQDLLRFQLTKTLSNLPRGEQFSDDRGEDIDALLSLIYFGLSTLVNKPTPGMLLENLRYRNEAWYEADPRARVGLLSSSGDEPTVHQRLGKGFFEILIPWIVGRVQRYMDEHEWSNPPLISELEEDEHEPSSQSSLSSSSSSSSSLSSSSSSFSSTFSISVNCFLPPLRAQAQWKQWCARMLPILIKSWKALSLLNSLVFLSEGHYSTLVDRVLRLRLVYVKRDAKRFLSFEFMNRELVWSHLTRFVLFLVTLTDWYSLRAAVMRTILQVWYSVQRWRRRRRLAREQRRRKDRGTEEEQGKGEEKKKIDDHLRRTINRDAEMASWCDAQQVRRRLACAPCSIATCPNSYSSSSSSSSSSGAAVMPYVAQCGHVFCYFCLSTACQEDPRFCCPKCFTPVRSSRRVI